MKGNIPIPELPFAEEVWLMVAVTSVRERRTQQWEGGGLLMQRAVSTYIYVKERLHPGLLDELVKAGAQTIEIFKSALAEGRLKAPACAWADRSAGWR